MLPQNKFETSDGTSLQINIGFSRAHQILCSFRIFQGCFNSKKTYMGNWHTTRLSSLWKSPFDSKHILRKLKKKKDGWTQCFVCWFVYLPRKKKGVVEKAKGNNFNSLPSGKWLGMIGCVSQGSHFIIMYLICAQR